MSVYTYPDIAGIIWTFALHIDFLPNLNTDLLLRTGFRGTNSINSGFMELRHSDDEGLLAKITPIIKITLYDTVALMIIKQRLKV